MTVEEKEELRRELSRDRRWWQNKLDSYDDDYTNLVDAEDEICQAMVIIEDTDSLSTTLNTEFDDIWTLATTDIVPGFESLFDFSKEKEENSSISQETTSLYSQCEKICQSIDDAKGEISKKIKDAQEHVDYYNQRIEQLNYM